MTVDPGSNITLNCSRGVEAGMTWKEAKKIIAANNTGSPDLILLQSNSTKDSNDESCGCTAVYFTRKSCFICSVLIFQSLKLQ